MTEFDEFDEFNNFDDIINKYKQNIDKINLDMKKKYFKFDSINNNKINNNKINITSYDDMYDVLYIKNRYFDKTIYKQLNYEITKSKNIINDIKKLLKLVFDDNYFDDTEFKSVTEHNDLNYLNPKVEDNIIYNSLKKNVFQQSDFRKDLYKLENEIKNLNFDRNIKINFFEDDEYTLVWMIIEIKNKD
jgi:hypothetical protein